MHTMLPRTKGRCCNKPTAWENENDDEIKIVSTNWRKRMEYFLERIIFQAGCRAEYQALDQLVGVYDTEVLSTLDMDMTQMYCLRQEWTKYINLVLTCRPKNVGMAVKACYSKLGVGLSTGSRYRLVIQKWTLLVQLYRTQVQSWRCGL